MATPIKSIRPNQQYDMIMVRFCRGWINNDIGTGRVISQDYILVDEEHETIHATIKSRDIDIVSPKVEIGQVYEIRRFFVDQNKPRYKVVPHNAMLQLTRATTFTPAVAETPSIPLHKFNFSDYDQLPAKIENNNLLSDVIGILTSIQPLEKSYVNNKMTSRKTIMIQNIRNEPLQVTLWGMTAEKFDEKIMQIPTETTVVIFTAVSVKQYLGKPYVASTSATICFFDLNIPEVQILKTRFANQVKKIELLPPSSKPAEPLDVQKTKNRIQINDLKNLDPNEKYTVRATIVGFDTTQGWFYNSCPTCNKMVKPSGTAWWCDDHAFLQSLPVPWYRLNTQIEDETGETTVTIFGKAAQILIKRPCSTLTIDEGFTDPSVIPPVIDQLKGLTKIFQIYFKMRGTTTGIVVSRIFDDQPPEILSLPSSTTATLDPKTPTQKQLPPSSEKTTPTSSVKRKIISQEEQEKKKKK